MSMSHFWKTKICRILSLKLIRKNLSKFFFLNHISSVTKVSTRNIMRTARKEHSRRLTKKIKRKETKQSPSKIQKRMIIKFKKKLIKKPMKIRSSKKSVFRRDIRFLKRKMKLLQLRKNFLVQRKISSPIFLLNLVKNMQMYKCHKASKNEKIES